MQKPNIIAYTVRKTNTTVPVKYLCFVHKSLKVLLCHSKEQVHYGNYYVSNQWYPNSRDYFKKQKVYIRVHYSLCQKRLISRRGGVLLLPQGKHISL